MTTVKKTIGYLLIVVCLIVLLGIVGNFFTYTIGEIFKKFNDSKTSGTEFLLSYLIGNGILLFILYGLLRLGIKLVKSKEMNKYKEHQVFSLIKDINPEIKKGMDGVILVIYNQNAFEVEFVKKDGTNYEYNGQSTFTIDSSYIQINFIR